MTKSDTHLGRELKPAAAAPSAPPAQPPQSARPDRPAQAAQPKAAALPLQAAESATVASHSAPAEIYEHIARHLTKGEDVARLALVSPQTRANTTMWQRAFDLSFDRMMPAMAPSSGAYARAADFEKENREINKICTKIVATYPTEKSKQHVFYRELDRKGGAAWAAGDVQKSLPYFKAILFCYSRHSIRAGDLGLVHHAARCLESHAAKAGRSDVRLQCLRLMADVRRKTVVKDGSMVLPSVTAAEACAALLIEAEDAGPKIRLPSGQTRLEAASRALDSESDAPFVAFLRAKMEAAISRLAQSVDMSKG